MSNQDEGAGVLGHSPEQWRSYLASGLKEGDHTGLKDLLERLGEEVKSERRIIAKHLRSPWYDRLIEQARQVFHTESTKLEDLEKELSAERELWGSFRQKYRETFVPKNLHPYLLDLALYIEPSEAPPTYEKFKKYTGVETGAKPEAVTLFDPVGESTSALGFDNVPNFFTGFVLPERTFIIRRAYRGGLPRGAGEDCLMEQLEVLAGPQLNLNKLSVENVKNSETYDVFVSGKDGARTVRPNPNVDDAPLVRLGRRIIERSGKSVREVTVRLDTFGFLDLHMEAS